MMGEMRSSLLEEFDQLVLLQKDARAESRESRDNIMKVLAISALAEDQESERNKLLKQEVESLQCQVKMTGFHPRFLYMNLLLGLFISCRPSC